MTIAKHPKGKTIIHNGETYVCDKDKNWYIRAADLRHNGEAALWQSIPKARVPIEVLKQT